MSVNDVEKIRTTLSNKYIKGKGLEIGALQIPLPVKREVCVIYVDRIDIHTAKNVHYPELKDVNLVNVDVLDDGEFLNNIPHQSQDFIIANHFLEHAQNPILAIKNHLIRIRSGGIIYYAIPDKWKTFDKNRPLTTFGHILRDYEQGPEISYHSHIEEWVELVNETPIEEREERIKKLKLINYAIHFHVWDKNTFRDFIEKSNSLLENPFDILEYVSVANENIVIIRKKKSIEENSTLKTVPKSISKNLSLPIETLMEVYLERDDLQHAYPEARDGKDLSRLLVWARNHGVKEENRLLRYSYYYETVG